MATEQVPENGTIYHIRAKGALDAKWADWFEDFVMTSRPNGDTLLSGRVADQAALHGVLAKIRGLDQPILLVVQSGCPCSAKRCPRHGHCQTCAAHHAENGKLPFCFRKKTRWDKHCRALVQGR